MISSKNVSAGLLLMRVTVGGLLLLHGLKKIEKPKETKEHLTGVLEENNMPPVLANGVYVGEVIAPLAIIFGYKTRLFSPIIAFNMLTAIYTVNMSKIDKREDTGAWGLETQAFFLFGGLALFFTGAGKYATSNDSKWD